MMISSLTTALKFLPKKILLSLTEIIKIVERGPSFKTCYFPIVWKIAVIISIPKPGKDHELSENYRPIALLSTLSKIYERLILTITYKAKIAAKFDENNSLSGQNTPLPYNLPNFVCISHNRTVFLLRSEANNVVRVCPLWLHARARCVCMCFNVAPLTHHIYNHHRLQWRI